MKKSALLIVIITISLGISAVSRAKTSDLEKVQESTNIHFTGKYCTECHLKKPESVADKDLKYNGDYSRLCYCHGYTPGTYIHPVDIEPSESKKSKIPDDFPLTNGKMDCATCHDMHLQCKNGGYEQSINKKFLRGAPYMNRIALCFKCHDEKKYAMLDPHNQISDTGEINKEKCMYCHAEMPNPNNQSFENVKLIGNLEVLCFRCHQKQSKFHPINANHLRTPSELILANMRESEEKLGVILPLDYEGKVTCPTCHNPHERGVLPSNKASSEGASEKYRLRLAAKNLEICVACHKDKFKNMQPE